MADKKQKKPRHTNLVVPGDSSSGEKRRWFKFGGDKKPDHQVEVMPTPPAAEGVEADGKGAAEAAGADGVSTQPEAKEKAEGKKGEKPKGGQKKGTATPLVPGTFDEVADADLPPNAIRMPKRKPKLSPAKRRRRRRRIRLALMAMAAAAAVLFYTSGLYLRAGVWVSDAFDSMLIAARPGDGFPMSFTIPDYVKAERMGSGGFAALGGKDVGIFSSTGKELWRSQHNYLSPGLSAGKTKVVVYSRGGKEYRVEGRSKTLAQITTEQDILFCEMSPDGWLAVVTSSRHRATLNIYGPALDITDPLLTWPLVDDTPLMAAFNSDNRSLVLGCLSVRDGALGTTLYLLRTDRDEVQGEIRADDARLLQLKYLDNHRVLAVYDRYSALYNSRGEELARYDYGVRRLLTAYVDDGQPTLVFGTTTGEMLHIVLLNGKLEQQFDVTTTGYGAPKVLLSGHRVFLLIGQEVLAYSNSGQLQGRTALNAKALGLVYGGQPLVLTVGMALPLDMIIAVSPVSEGDSLSQSGSASSSAYEAEAPLSEPVDDESGSAASSQSTAEGEGAAPEGEPTG